MAVAHDTASAMAGARWVVKMAGEEDIMVLGNLTGTKYGESIERGQSRYGNGELASAILQLFCHWGLHLPTGEPRNDHA